jgi:hypothetical protein
MTDWVSLTHYALSALICRAATERTYPRVIKRARHNSYRVKRPGDHGTRHSGRATIKLVNLDLPALAA